jgi:hypothetical protein
MRGHSRETAGKPEVEIESKYAKDKQAAGLLSNCTPACCQRTCMQAAVHLEEMKAADP